jgi:hypothetical protein
MGSTKGSYNAEYLAGSLVQIATRRELEEFRQSWKYHHPITEEQLEFAGKIAKVKEVGFYHGGDELYILENIPGIWHEKCLRYQHSKNNGE